MWLLVDDLREGLAIDTGGNNHASQGVYLQSNDDCGGSVESYGGAFKMSYHYWMQQNAKS
jgi:hypothetical protein